MSLEPAALRQPPTLEQLQNIWRHVVLDADAKARLLNCIQRFNSQAAVPPRGLLIHGAPGTGKTEIIRHIAESVSGAFMGLTLKDLADRYAGQTASLVQEVWRKARSYGRCVITLDWCEGIFAGPGTPRGGASEELVSVFRAQWHESVEHGAGVWFVGETYRPEPMHPAILALFDTIIETRSPVTWTERVAIMTLVTRSWEPALDIPAFIEPMTAGMSGRDLSRLVRDVRRQALNEGGAAPSDMTWRDVLETMRRQAGA